ncbi:uncharacterized protein [Callorhinus ursinus]|uniref:uncharacterized protein n=1 Tax=Callorhinus ursinus TaxID=34884 RepID=UPI003CD00682
MGKLRNHPSGFKPAHENAPGQFVLSALATGGAENEVCRVWIVSGSGPGDNCPPVPTLRLRSSSLGPCAPQLDAGIPRQAGEQRAAQTRAHTLPRVLRLAAVNSRCEPCGAGAEIGAPGAAAAPPSAGTHRCACCIPSDGPWSRRRWSRQVRSWRRCSGGGSGACTVCPRVAPSPAFIGSRQLRVQGRLGGGSLGWTWMRGGGGDGGGDLPVLGAGQEGEAPGAGRTPSRRALSWAQDLLSCPAAPLGPRPGPRVPGLATRLQALGARGGGGGGSRVPGWDWGWQASRSTPSPSWARSLAAALTARDPGPWCLSSVVRIVTASLASEPSRPTLLAPPAPGSPAPRVYSLVSPARDWQARLGAMTLGQIGIRSLRLWGASSFGY